MLIPSIEMTILIAKLGKHNIFERITITKILNSLTFKWPLCQCPSGSAIKISGSRIHNKIRGSGSAIKKKGSWIHDKIKGSRSGIQDPR
jgi:hypothetical protein